MNTNNETTNETVADESKKCFVITMKLHPSREQKSLLSRLVSNATLFYNFLHARVLEEFSKMFENEKFRECWNYGWEFRKFGKLQAVQRKLEAKRDKLSKEDAEFLEELPSQIRQLEDKLSFVKDEYFPDVKPEKVYTAAYKEAMKFIGSWIINEPEQAAFDYKPCTFSKFGFIGLGGCLLQNVAIDGIRLNENLINSGIGQAISERLWSAWEKKLAFENFGKKVFLHEKTEPVYSVKFKNNIGLKFEFEGAGASNRVWLKGKENGGKFLVAIPFTTHFRKKDTYNDRALEANSWQQPMHTAIVWRQMGDNIRTGEKNEICWYVQLTLPGLPPSKGHKLGTGKVGVDLGPEYVTAENGKEVRKWHLRNPRELTGLIESLQVRMDEDDRAHNPDNYGEDGVPKKGARNVHSEEYLKMKAELAYARFRLVEFRRNLHGRMVREVMGMGHDFVTEKDPVKEWQQRLEEPEGPLGSKANYGEEILNSAPSEFIGRLEQKVSDLGGTLTRVPCDIACTQFDHTDKSFTRRSVAERTFALSDGEEVDQDAIAAFNLRHTNRVFVTEGKGRAAKPVKSPENFDVKSMRKDYAEFLKAQAEWRKAWEAEKAGSDEVWNP